MLLRRMSPEVIPSERRSAYPWSFCPLKLKAKRTA